MLVLGIVFIVQASAVEASYIRHGYPPVFHPTVLQTPVMNAHAGSLGTPWMSPYFVGLRGGRITHQVQDYNMRRSISAAFYPQDRITGPIGWRHYRSRPAVGGFYGGNLASFTNVRYGDFVFSGQ